MPVCEPVWLLEGVPDCVPVAELLGVPVALGDDVIEGVTVLVAVTDGMSTTGSLTVSPDCKSTGLMPVVLVYWLRKPDWDRESISGDDDSRLSDDCALLRLVTMLDAASCCWPVAALIDVAVGSDGMRMATETEEEEEVVEVVARRLLLSLLPPVESAAPSAMTSWYHTARPGPRSAREPTTSKGRSSNAAEE